MLFHFFSYQDAYIRHDLLFCLMLPFLRCLFNFHSFINHYFLLIHQIQRLISGKSTLACTLSQNLHSRGKLTYILDGDNVRHGLNKDLSFKAEDRAENIRRIGQLLYIM